MPAGNRSRVRKEERERGERRRSRTHDLDPVDRKRVHGGIIRLWRVQERVRHGRGKVRRRKQNEGKGREGKLTDDLEHVLIDGNSERSCRKDGTPSAEVKLHSKGKTRLTVEAIVGKAKADALVWREVQFREVELVELRARLIRRRVGAVEDGASVDEHSLR